MSKLDLIADTIVASALVFGGAWLVGFASAIGG